MTQRNRHDEVQGRRCQADLQVLLTETKRQFNLGASTNAIGNTQFPPLLRRMVDIAVDPLLRDTDLSAPNPNPTPSDMATLAAAVGLLAELKGIVLQTVRSLSKYGTGATIVLSQTWNDFADRSLNLLEAVAAQVVSADSDDAQAPAVLANLTGKNLATEVVPYFVLANNGGALLESALAIYGEIPAGQLESYDKQHLITLFQPQGRVFWTTTLRREAEVIRRYPLQNWV